MRTLIFHAKRTINKKVTILGSSGSPEKGNLNKHIHNDATVSYNNVKNYALHTTLKLEDLANLYSKPQSLIHLSWRKNLQTKIFVAASEIIFSTPPDLMSCQQTPFQRTTLRLTMLLLGFPRGGMVVDRLLEALARDAGRGIVCTTTTIVALKCFFFTLVSIDREDFFVEV